MSEMTTVEADLAIAPADSPARREFRWEGKGAEGEITIERTSQSSPVWIQANN